jgi:hypothetical protein
MISSLPSITRFTLPWRGRAIAYGSERAAIGSLPQPNSGVPEFGH